MKNWVKGVLAVALLIAIGYALEIGTLKSTQAEIIPIVGESTSVAEIIPIVGDSIKPTETIPVGGDSPLVAETIPIVGGSPRLC